MSETIQLNRIPDAKKAKKQIKYHMVFIILLLLLGLFVFTLMQFGNNALPFGMFIIFFLLPVFIVFSDSFSGIVPSVLRDVLLYDAPPQKAPSQPFFSSEGRLSRKNKQYLLLVSIVISIILVLYFISKIYPDVVPNGKIGVKENTGYQLVGAIVLTCMIFVMNSHFYEISANSLQK